MTLATLTDRLATLPPKVQAPLRELLAAGLITEDVIATVLDAIDLAGASDKALVFTIGLMHMDATGVPIKEAIRMAQVHQRRICLAWSPRRWKEEYDHFCRIYTLKRLANARVQYDVSAFAAALPARFRGYLIRTSGRLGMEGLRQRHCIASYHEQLSTGRTAIASVFVHRQRWTVELSHTGHDAQAVTIAQVRGRFNSAPTKEVLAAIVRELALDASSVPLYLTEAASPPCYRTNLQRVLQILRTLQATTVTVNFDGAQDTLEIYGAVYGSAKDIDTEIGVDIDIVATSSLHGQCVSRVSTVNVNLATAIYTVTNDLLRQVADDWYDGEGGFGTLKIDVEAGLVTIEIYTRVVRARLRYAHTHVIQTGVTRPG